MLYISTLNHFSLALLISEEIQGSNTLWPQMPLPVAILYHTRLLLYLNTANIQRSNLILWRQSPRFPQGFNKLSQLLYFQSCGPQHRWRNIKTNTEWMRRDLASQELVQQQGGMWLLAYSELNKQCSRAHQENCFAVIIPRSQEAPIFLEETNMFWGQARAFVKPIPQNRCFMIFLSFF